MPITPGVGTHALGNSSFRITAAAACIAALVAAPARADIAVRDAGDPSGPLTHVQVGSDLSCQAQHSGDGAYELFPQAAAAADCGTFLAVDGALYAPDFAAHAGGTSTAALGAYTPWTPVAQNAVKGGVATTAIAGGSGIEVVQSDSYNAGQDAWRTDVTVRNTGAATKSVTVYRAGNCFMQGTDTGYGFADLVGGGGGCAAQPDNSPRDRIVQWVPITHAASFVQGRADEVWTRIAARTAFPGSCLRCTTETDNAAGLSWSFDVVPGGSITRSHWTVLSPVGRTGPPDPVAPPPPTPPTTTSVGGGTTITFTGPRGCVPAGRRYKLRVTSMRKKRISRDRFGYERRVRILRVDFDVDGERRLTDTRAAFKARLASAGAAPGAHGLAARVLLQPLKARGRQVLVGRKFRRTLPSAVNICPPAT